MAYGTFYNSCNLLRQALLGQKKLCTIYAGRRLLGREIYLKGSQMMLQHPVGQKEQVKRSIST